MIKTRRRTVAAKRIVKAAKPRRAGTRAVGSDVRLGEIVRWDQHGPLVDFPGNERGPLRARVAGAAPGAQLAASAGTAGARRQEVVLLVDPRASRAPVVLGFLTPIGGDATAPDLEARVDGRRVEIDGRDEIVLRCGEASITLRRNGRIVIRGVDVETRAAGVNRIKGGTVSIN
jgi:hypothetical protein